MSQYEGIMEIGDNEDTNSECTSEVNSDPNEFGISNARRTTQLVARKSLIWARDYLEKLPIKLTLGNLGAFAVVLAVIMPRTLTYVLVYPIFRLVFGTLYPAYASYKAVRTKNVKEYVKWMMYWIVFALFTCAETFTDVFFSFWFPFYYEIKIILVLWLLSPATKGSSILYRRFVHPALSRREAEIDDALARATEQGYTAVLHLGTRGVNYATTVLMQTAIKGGGGLVQQLKKSYSLSDLTGEKEDENRNTSSMRDETDMEAEPRRRENPGRRGYSPRRTQSSSNRVEMYFSEVDVDVGQPRSRDPIASLKSSDDISSGYSSGEALQPNRVTSQGDSLLRTSSVGARTRARPRSATTKKIPEVEEDDGDYELSSSSETLQFPSPMSLLSARQSLELVLLLSQINPRVDKEAYDIIASGHLTEEFGNNSTSRTVFPEPMPEESTERTESRKVAATIEEIVESPGKEDARNPQETKNPAEDRKTICSLVNETANNEELARRDIDDICQDKLEELKVLLRDARKAVTNIVSSHEKFYSTDKSLANDDTNNASEHVQPGFFDAECSSVNSEELWTTPNASGSNSENDCRAGRYNKKPAPKIPVSKSDDELAENEAAARSALKATLVIKTGRLKTFTNTSETKNVFVSHLPDSSKWKKKRLRKREGFSKLLTIPKTIFNHAFHKDSKDTSSNKDEDSSSSQGSRSRSTSVGSRGDANNPLRKRTIVKDSAGTRMSFQGDGKRSEIDFQCGNSGPDDLEASEKMQDTNMTEESGKEAFQDDAPETGTCARPTLIVRQMSHSPTRNSGK